MSSKDNNIIIKDNHIWLIPACTLFTMIIACCVAIVMLVNTGLPGLFSQVDLGVEISQKSLNSFSRKTNVVIDTSISEKSLSTHKYVCRGETAHEDLPISSDEFSSFIAYAMPGDFPIKSTQVKFNDGGTEISSKVKLSDLLNMMEGEDSQQDTTDDPFEPSNPHEPIMPEYPESPDFFAGPTAIRTMDFADPEYEEDSDANEEGLAKLISLLPSNVNVNVKGSGVILFNEIINFEVDVLNLSGFNITDFVDEETAYELSKAIVNGIIETMNDKLNINFVYAFFTEDAMIFTGTMPRSITMVKK